MSIAIPTLTGLPSSFTDRRFFSFEGGPPPELDVVTGAQALEMTALSLLAMAPQIVAEMEEEEPSTMVSRTLDISPSKPPSKSSYTEDAIVLNNLLLPIGWEEAVDKFFEHSFSKNDLRVLAALHTDDKYRRTCAWMFGAALGPPLRVQKTTDTGTEACFEALHLFATAALLKQLSAILLCAWNTRTDRDDEQQLERLKRVTQFIMDIHHLQLDNLYQVTIMTKNGTGRDGELATDLKSRFVADRQSPTSPSIDGHITNFLTSCPQKSLKFIFDDRKMTMDCGEASALHFIAQVLFSFLLMN